MPPRSHPSGCGQSNSPTPRQTRTQILFAIAAPLPILGPIAEALVLRRYMMALNRERNAVIAGKGGVLEVLSNLVRSGLGGAQGSGAQYVSWIHEADFVRSVDFLIANETLTGPVNICSPNPLRNREFMRALRASWRQPVGVAAPAWMIEIGSFLLRTESELVLKSRRVIPGRLLNAGFCFTYPEWPAAALKLVSRYRCDAERA